MNAPLSKSSRRTLLFAGAVPLLMLGLSFAAEPLYSTFCKITGFGGTTREAVSAPTRVLDRVVRVRFDANLDPRLELKFAPEEPFIETRIGETTLSFYDVTNLSDRPVRAMASYNVAPHKAGRYFNKLQCFCFVEKVFAPGETARLPVVFFIAPELDDDRQMDDVAGITLSYTYFPYNEGSDNPALEGTSLVN